MERDTCFTIKMKFKDELFFKWRLRRLQKQVGKINSQIEKCQAKIERASAAMAKLAESELQFYLS